MFVASSTGVCLLFAIQVMEGYLTLLTSSDVAMFGLHRFSRAGVIGAHTGSVSCLGARATGSRTLGPIRPLVPLSASCFCGATYTQISCYKIEIASHLTEESEQG